MTQNFYLSLVIPTYNEEKNIKKTIETILDFLKGENYNFELIISDDDSKDKTKDIVSQFQKEDKRVILLANSHGGKGPTLISGFQKAKGDIVCFTDADLATPITELPKLLTKIQESFDVVIGSRGMVRQGAPITRLIAALSFSLLVQTLALPGVSDSQCGFKAFKRKALFSVLSKMKLYAGGKKMKDAAVTAGFDVELLFLAKKLGFKIGEVPVDWHYVGTERVNLLREPINAFFDVFKIRINDLKGIYSERKSPGIHARDEANFERGKENHGL